MTTRPARQPNILIIVIDSLRADHVSSYGYPRPTTPHIDRLAREGCLFRNAITAAPFSPPSYASIISGLYPHQHGVNGDTIRVWPNDWPRLPEKLKQLDYTTFCLSNNSFISPESNSTRGFDEFVYLYNDTWPVRQYHRVLRRVRKFAGGRIAHRLTTNAMNCLPKGDSMQTIREAVRIIDQNPGPFFGLLVLMDTHVPYNRRRTAFAGRDARVRRFFHKYNHQTMWAEFMAHRLEVPSDTLQVIHDLYDGEARHADHCVGRLLAALQQRGRLDDTFIAVAADHGEAFGEYGVWGHGFCLNDCLTRVPLVIRHPATFKPGSQCDALVQLHDLHPTALSLATGSNSSTDEHHNSLTHAADPAWTGRPCVFSEFPVQTQTLDFMRRLNPQFKPGLWDKAMWAVRTPHWRYLAHDGGPGMLFDLQNDPSESASVIDQHPDLARRLSEVLQQHRADQPLDLTTADLPSQEMDESIRERLRALGYIA